MADCLGGAFLSAFLQVLFDRLASRDVLDFIKGRKLTTQLLDNLDTSVNTVRGLLDDAEELQITKPAVEKWLKKLENVVHDANDLVDEIAYESLRSKMEPEERQVNKIFSSLNLFGESMDRKLEEILARLEYLVKQKDALGLREGIGKYPSSHKEPTTSVVNETTPVYGRDKDKEAIIELLLSDDPNGNNVGVIPIVGMGGLGKTTLAQLIYNDTRVKTHFPLRAWICVSEKNNMFEIFKDVIEEVTGKKCDSTTPNKIEIQLQKKLKENKFFLVLDDIWDSKSYNWDRLSTPFMSGARGSKIIVTTRIQKVASDMGTTPSYNLKELSDEDCWSLFAKRAFADVSSAAHPHLEVIGRKIVGRCGGLPLAAKALGSILRSKRNAAEWEKLSNSRFWDLSDSDILPVLRLSYHYLPSHLKRCFAYCAIFPKGYRFMKDELISLWMAEGFLIQPEGDEGMQDVGDKYFEDLISRSFFQPSSVHDESFIMHDLIHDLAEFVSREFCVRLDGGDLNHISESSHHSSVPDYEWKGKMKGQLLQTFLVLTYQYQWHFSGKEAMKDSLSSLDVLSSLKRLRVLSLPWHLCLREVPDSIGSLKHLRHLNLSGAPIRSLPESLSNLYNLQTLNLFSCRFLLELPTKMGRLINLCRLDTRETKLQKMPPEMGNLKELRLLSHFIIGKESRTGIKELGKLKHIRGELNIQNLQNVTDAEDAKEANMKIREQLKKLQFQWSGEIDDSEHVRQVLEMLRPHTNLECLDIIGYGGTQFPIWVGDSSFSNLVSLKLNGCENCLQLPPLGQLLSLKDLWITGFDILTSVGPEFYGSCSKPFNSLEVLLFERMPHWCEWSDQVEAFPLLRELHISECPSLKKTLPSNLPLLEIVRIYGCPELMYTIPRASNSYSLRVRDNRGIVEWEKSLHGLGTSYRAFSLNISNFDSAKALPEILKLPDDLCTSLQSITISNCISLKCFPSESFPKLTKLDIIECPNLESLNTIEKTAIDQSGSSSASRELTNLPRIEEFDIRECPQLSMRALLPWVPTVRLLTFCDSSRDFCLTKLPSGMHCLEIRRCLDIRGPLLMEQNDSEEIKIRNIDLLEGLSGENFPKSVKRLEITDDPIKISFPGAFHAPYITEVEFYNSNLELLPDWKNSIFPSLVELSVYNCPNLMLIPEESLSSRLKVLTIIGCPKLQSVPECMKFLLPSLLKLTILDCQELDSFLNGGLPSTLECLEIKGCDKVIGDLMKQDLRVLSSLSKFVLGGNKDLESFPQQLLLPAGLSSLLISDLENLKSLDYEGLSHLTAVAELSISNCPKLRSVSGFMQSLLPSLWELTIVDCPEVESFLNGGLPLKLKSLCIIGCDKVIGDIMKQDLRMLSSLSVFRIERNKDVDSFPQEMLLPSGLSRLEISHFNNLKFLDYKGLSCLTSLTELTISYCPKLQSLPAEGLPSTTSVLTFNHQWMPLTEARVRTRERGRLVQDCT